MVSAAPKFKLLVRPEADRIVVAPQGELDIATLGPVVRMLARLRAAGEPSVVLDLRGVTFADSSTAHVIVEAHRAAAAGHVKFAVIGGSPGVQRVLDLCGVDSLVEYAAA